MPLNMLCDVGSSFTIFFNGVARTLGFDGLFAIALAIEAFLVFLFALLTAYCYERRLARSIDKLNAWLFNNRKINADNIKEFNALVRKGPKRLQYYWQQFILFREGDPTSYMSLENLVEKPLKTSVWDNNIKNLKIATIIWAGITLIFSIALANDASAGISALSLTLPVIVIAIGFIAAIFMKSRKTLNLDDIYQHYHIFARFVSNACVDLPSYIDFDLLFDSKEIAKGNPQLREYYEARARKAKEEFENAQKSDVEYVEYDFVEAGVDGSLVLERAMHETEAFINKKTSILAKIAHVEAEKEALRRNYENVQKDLQRKIQACKENINKLIAQQEATTNRMEVGFIRKQQEQEISKQESLQTEYDQEETRYAISTEELNQEIAKLRKELDDSKDSVQKAMISEYQTFYEKVMTSAKNQANRRVEKEKSELVKERDNSERELVVVQTQIKRLVDENNTLRARLGDEITEQTTDGYYDEHGNFIYKDGSYHDPNGLFHDIDGKIYDMNGTLIEEPKTEEEQEQLYQLDEIKAFGAPRKEAEPAKEPEVKAAEPVVQEPKQKQGTPEQAAKAKRGRPRKPQEQKATVTEAKKRGRPRKEQAKPQSKKPVGRPKKSVVKNTKNDENKLANLQKINAMINEEEGKLSKMKMLIDSEISDAMTTKNETFAEERNRIMKEIESLQAQAQSVKEEASAQELERINSRLEALIKQVAALNDE